MSPSRANASPYPGTRAYEPSDAADFFGRGEELAHAMETLQLFHCLAIVGPARAGKSSLARAGVIPAWAKANARCDWRVAVARADRHPLRAVARAMMETRSSGTGLGRAAVSAVDRERAAVKARILEERLRREPRYLAYLIGRKAEESRRPFRLLIVVDQFEEALASHDAMVQKDLADTVAALVETQADLDSRTDILITLTDSAIALRRDIPGLRDLLEHQCRLAPAMPREAMLAAAMEPARARGRPLDPTRALEIVRRAELGDQPLPALQRELESWWFGYPARNRVADPTGDDPAGSHAT